MLLNNEQKMRFQLSIDKKLYILYADKQTLLCIAKRRHTNLGYFHVQLRIVNKTLLYKLEH